MKRKILFILFMCVGYICVYAQGKDGSSYYNAIPIMIQNNRFSFFDTKNTAVATGAYTPYYQEFPDGSYRWTEGKVVYYRFETTREGDFIIHNWGSGLKCTNLFLVTLINPSIIPEPMAFSYPVFTLASFEKGDFYLPDDQELSEDFSGMQGYIYVPSLPAGIYYIIAGGWKGGNMGMADGNIRTTLIASFSNAVPPEAPLLPESVNLSPVQYKYDLSGNRIKTIKKQ